MKRHSDNQARIVDYLLGALPEAELLRFEQSYLGDETLFEELQEIEDELIDDYASGALDAEQRAQFEEYFLRSPERREKVDFAQTMTGRAAEWKKGSEAKALLPTVLEDTKPSDVTELNDGKATVLPFRRWSQPVPAWREWAAIAAAVLIAIGGSMLWLRNRELQRELIAANAEAENSRQRADAEHAQVIRKDTELSDKLEELHTVRESLVQLQQPGGGVNLVYRLSREFLWSGSKGAGEKKVKALAIPGTARSVSLNLDFEKTDFQKFKATLRRDDKSVAWSSVANLKAITKTDLQSVKVSIPPNKLLPGNYEVVISGVTPEGNTESVGRYYLKILRQ